MIRVSSEGASGRRGKRKIRTGKEAKNQVVDDGHIMGGGLIFEEGSVSACPPILGSEYKDHPCLKVNLGHDKEFRRLSSNR
jgi:hypothetical protein